MANISLELEQQGEIMTEYLAKKYTELGYREFYRVLFGNYLETTKQRENREKYCYPAIAKVVFSKEETGGKNRVKKFLVTDDLEAIGDAIKEEGVKTLLAPLDYVGSRATMNYATRIYGFAIDLDYLVFGEEGQPFGLLSLIQQWTKLDDYIPVPTMIASSGSGLHIYYVFEEPIRLNQVSIKELKKLKVGLTARIWNSDVTEHHNNVQQESIYQDMRVIGSTNKYGGSVRGFLVGETVSIEYLNSFLNEKYRANFVANHVSLREAKEKWKEWYQERIVEGKPKKDISEIRWHINKNKKRGDKLALFHWWEKLAFKLGKVGHRYNCLKILAIMANKNEVPKEEFERAFYQLAEKFKNLAYDDKTKLTEDDIEGAKEFFGKENYITYPTEVMRYRSGIDFDKPKRNKRKQSTHIKYMNSLRSFKVENGECTNGGRPEGSGTKKEIVAAWQAAHPDGKKIDCEKETGLSRHTVLKWWKK